MTQPGPSEWGGLGDGRSILILPTKWGGPRPIGVHALYSRRHEVYKDTMSIELVPRLGFFDGANLQCRH